MSSGTVVAIISSDATVQAGNLAANDILAHAFKVIEPSLTLGTAEIALMIVFFQIGRFFWDYERDQAKENVEDLRDVLGGFKDAFIRPTLVNQTRAWVNAAYSEAINGVSNHVMGAVKASTSLNEKDVADLFTTYNKENLLSELNKNDKVSEFYSTEEGVSLLVKLDAQFIKAREYRRIFDCKIACCRNITMQCFAIAGIFILGLFNLIVNFPETLRYFLVFSLFILLISGIINFAKFEYYRRNLMAKWQELKTLGNFDA